MPAAIGTAIASWAASITVTQVVFTVASMVISSVMASRAQKKAEAAQRAAAEQQRAAYNAGLVDRTTVLRTGIQPRNIILGRDEASGPLVCWFTYGNLRNYHAFAVVLAGHECDAIETILFNHEPVTLNAGGGVIAPAKYTRTKSHTFSREFPGGPAGTACVLVDAPTRVDVVLGYGTAGSVSIGYTVAGNVLTTTQSVPVDAEGNFSAITVSYTVVVTEPLFYIKKYLGAPGQQAAPELIAAASSAGMPDSWGADRKGTGICYVTVWFEADFNILGQIGVPNISGITRGAKAYDPRIGGDPVWTQNPAILARWFNVDSGFAPKTLATEINTAELLASANVSDEAVSFSATEVGARYVCDGQLTSAAIPMDNFNHILDAMDGDAVWISGQWQIIAGYYKEPTLVMDEDTLSGASISVVPRTAKRDLFNAIKGQFVDASNQYTRTGYGLVTSDFYQAQDGNELLPAEANFELVNDSRRCQMIAWQRLTRARQPLTVQLGTTLKGYDTAPLQTVDLSLRRLGYVNKVFVNLRREHEKNTLIHVLQETGPEVWDWDYSKASSAVDIPNTSFPDVSTIPVPADVEVYSGTDALQLLGDGTVLSRGRIRWAQVTNTFVLDGGKIEWQHKNALDTSDNWVSLEAARGEDVEIFTGPLVDGDVMLVRGRCVTGGGRKGDWSPIKTFKVVGKTELPPDVVSFTIDGSRLDWSQVAALDLLGYEIRFNYGSNTWWDGAARLHGGVITTSPYTLSQRPQGVVTLLIKVVDTSGNYSLNAAVIVANLGDLPVANLLLSWPQAPTFAEGEISGGSVVGGELVADGLDEFFTPPNEAMFSPDTDPFFPAGSYADLVYTWTVTPTAPGTLLLDHEIEAGNFQIEYLRGSQDAIFSPPGDFFFSPGTEPMFGNGSALAVWPGSLSISEPEAITFRITAYGGTLQGKIIRATAVLDVPDVTESGYDLVVSAAGTRLPITKTYRVIEIVGGLTVQGDGNGGVSARIKNGDKNPVLGPLVEVIDKNEVPVIGLIDWDCQGY